MECSFKQRAHHGLLASLSSLLALVSEQQPGQHHQAQPDGGKDARLGKSHGKVAPLLCGGGDLLQQRPVAVQSYRDGQNSEKMAEPSRRRRAQRDTRKLRLRPESDTVCTTNRANSRS